MSNAFPRESATSSTLQNEKQTKMNAGYERRKIDRKKTTSEDSFKEKEDERKRERENERKVDRDR
jgi:hypothetical protein